MPRMARVVLPHYPHHIVQRGHNRQVTFAERADFEWYVATLREFKKDANNLGKRGVYSS